MIVGKKEKKPVLVSEEYQAEYRIEQGQVEFIKYIGQEEEYEIPAKMDGCPVKLLAPYAFSEHRNLAAVHLPPDLKRIGAHAFYNCRGLEELSLYDRLEEIDDGAFKNCRKLSHLTLSTSPDRKLVIKNILMDSTEGIGVTIYYEEKDQRERAEVIFPPYLVEYEENTPARICEKQAYGSGERYRHCLYDGQLNFDQYDQLFDFSVAVDALEYPIQTCVNRLRFPYQLKPDYREHYEKFLNDRLEKVLSFYIKREEKEVLEWFLEQKLLSKEGINVAAELCRTYQKNGLLPLLMEYQNENFKPKKKSFAL
jgi:hypothetical protein